MTDAPPPKGPDDYGVVLQFEKPTSGTQQRLPTVPASAFAGRPIPSRPWLVKDIVPDRTVTLLSGDGGVGKSLLALQLAVATAAMTGWIGTLPEPGPVIYLSAEDDIEEVHRRLADIIRAEGLGFDDLADLHIISMAGRDAVLTVTDARSGKLAPTSVWNALGIEVTTVFPRLLILDNLADVFAGNENSRAEARQFIGILRGLAIEQNLAVLLIGHPSLQGLNSGTGTSGSTAWSNSVRSRLYFTKPTSEDGGGSVDDDLRLLKVMKANYGPAGTEIRLRWHAGHFRLEGRAGGLDKASTEIAADDVFLALVRRFQKQDRSVSDKSGANFAPAVFAGQPEASGQSKTSLKAAMERLFTAGKIKIEKVGPPSRQLRSIIIVEDDSDK